MILGKVSCELCGREFHVINHTHLVKYHNMTLREYMDSFPEAPLYNKFANEKHTGKELLNDALQRQWNK
jgi:hypothetical protein